MRLKLSTILWQVEQRRQEARNCASRTIALRYSSRADGEGVTSVTTAMPLREDADLA
jgi:hypothetical protein